jgi:hypothetical protein
MAHLEKLGLRMIVLYNSPYIENESDLIDSLEKFTKDGGKVLVIGPSSKKIRSLVGIKTSFQFTVHQGDSSFQSFSPLKSVKSYFTNPSSPVPIFESYSPETKSLKDCVKEDTYILGSSTDELVYLTVNGSYFYYSGLLSNLDFERKQETFTFFVDLLELPLVYSN